MSMTVEKSTADDVRKKFEELKKDKDQPMPVDSVLDGMCLLLSFSIFTQQTTRVRCRIVQRGLLNICAQS